MKQILLVGLMTAAAVLLLNSRLSSKQAVENVEILGSFEAWAKEHGKQYTPSEAVFRLKQFGENYRLIAEHNRRHALGLETYDLALNQFADLDRVEFKALYTGLKKKAPSATLSCTGKVTPVANPPAEVDWTTKNVVTPVKNQGQCGSCWAFSTTGALEGLAALEKGKLPSLSEQQLVDCAGGVYTNEGCNGGDMDAAMWYVIDNGITDEATYPYKARDQKCTYKDTQKVYQIKNCAEVTANKTAALVEAVATQPVAISVEADQAGFQFYKSGVFNGKCGTDLDHGILLVGYGTLNGVAYWKAKNSWGGSWGSNGYILLGKGADGPGVCGILMDNTVPLQSV